MVTVEYVKYKEVVMRYIQILLILVLFIPFSLAQDANIQKGLSWLVNNSNFDQDLESSAMSALVLSFGDKDVVSQKGFARILDRKDTKGCWPKNNCNVKDTAFGLLVLNTLNQNIGDTVTWLESAQIPALTNGKWLIQIESNADGQCKISYKDNTKEKAITLQKGRVVECGGSHFIDVDTCLEKGIMKNSVKQEFNVDCTNLASSAIISLIFQVNNEYFLLQDFNSNVATLVAQNACLGESQNSKSCNYKSTLFASWVLSKSGKEVATITYLRSQLDDKDTLAKSLLFLITKRSIYQDLLLKDQNPQSGGFANVYESGYAHLSLKGQQAEENVSKYLLFQQSLDGSWNKNQRDTSIVLYSYLEEEKVKNFDCKNLGYSCCSACAADFEHFEGLDSSCTAGNICCEKCLGQAESTCNELGGIQCKFDERCIGGSERTKDVRECCLGICEKVQLDCDYDGFCDSNEDKDKCPADCKAEEIEEAICDDKFDNDDDGQVDCDDLDCATDPECKDSGFPWWILIIVFTLIVIGFIVYKKKLISIKGLFRKKEIKKDEAKPSFTQPTRMQTNYDRESIDLELNKSLEEAKKLLGKK